MPLIRYDMGDKATASDEVCSCGRALPLIASVDGRQSDFLIAADETEVHGEFFTHLFYGRPDVAQFQVVQQDRMTVVLRVVPVRVAEENDYSDIVEKMSRVLGEGVNVDVEICESIPPSRSGKHRFTICEIETR
jgi:phenylacetate-CoA ligase